MPVVAEISIPGEEFVLGRALDDYPDCSIEFEPVVPFDTAGELLFRVSSGDPDEIHGLLSEWPDVDVLQLLAEEGTESLFELDIDTTTDCFLESLRESHVHVFEARGGLEEWELQLHFADHAGLVGFNEQLTESGIPVTLNRLNNPSRADQPSLSPQQREAVELAYRSGYFDVPRSCRIQDLAAEVGISDSAFSQRLRRGLGSCVREALDLR